MFETRFTAFSALPGAVNLVGASIIIDKLANPGIQIAARNLASDFGKVTRSKDSPIEVIDDELASTADVSIVIGCIESSPILTRLEQEKKVDFQAIRGKWESFTTTLIHQPFDGCSHALVIAGSDKRGAIFGTYTLSEQIGVSPWHYWADVPPKHHAEIFALPIHTIHGEPSIRYRGIFINDEAPALTGWVRETFGKYGVEFYEKVFELLLRLKANFMWPAMWPGYPNPGASFFVDDPRNQITAEEYGICVSTSHHEPMQRLSNEWFADNPDGSWNWITNKEKITKFFEEGVQRAKNCESYFTLGMRGEYDRKMVTDDPAAVVRDVIQTQRHLIKEVHGSENAVPQLLALYKEVQEQYESGKIEVPDDVTLLFADDNFGTIRRLPCGKEIERKGGAGIYYHFEYVGVPRSYKWINSNSLGKTWHQLQQAYQRNARQIWVFNVGDIKPMEVPITFAMALAWDIKCIEPEGLADFFTTMATREFGSDLSQDISTAWHEYDRLMSLRRHEHIEPDTFSLLHYNEAEIVLERWKSLLARAERICKQVSQEAYPAIFELVLHPIKASYIFTTLQITLGRNRLYARQRRNTANKLAGEVLRLFDEDYSLSEEFHQLLNGKWNQIMRQTHYGYEETWHAPSRDMISGLCYVQRRQNSNPVMGQMGVAVEGHAGVRPGLTNEESDRTHPSRRDLVPGVTLGQLSRYGPPSRWFDIYTRGSQTIHWKTQVPYDWIRLSSTSGTAKPDGEDSRITITIDWDSVPEDFNSETLIDIISDEGDFEQVHLPITGRKVLGSFKNGFVESGGYVSIPAPLTCLGKAYRVLPDTGRSIHGSVNLIDPTEPISSFLEYNIYTFTEQPSANLALQFNMTLDVDPTAPMTYEFQLDEGPLQMHRLIPEKDQNGELPPGWIQAVQDCVWTQRYDISTQMTQPGSHTLRVRLHHTNLLLERLVIDLGGIKESYLGPPDSSCI